ncbi:lysophospholipid acyltransferase family protein [Hyphococcus sp. DH-69]|uniref:lysophospholipid acyltransferase family protein n=1 Tax=Hyphococcus formosus TaxID=3143534 RepID=UPI00398ABA74
MLIAIRSLIFTILLILSIAVMGIICLPMIINKNAARKTVQLWARIALWLLHHIAGVKLHLEGKENIPQSGAIIAANHQSMWETIALYALMPKPVMILKKELLNIPVYGWWARGAGNVAINRQDGAKALRAMTRQTVEHIEAGEQVIVFPEGTRIPPGERASIKPGVAGLYAATKTICVPVAHDSGRHWLHPGIKKIPGTITMRILPPIQPGLDRKSFTEELRGSLERARPDLEDQRHD